MPGDTRHKQEMGQVRNENGRTYNNGTTGTRSTNKTKRKNEHQRKNKKRLNQYKNNRKLGNFLRYAVKRKGPTPMATTLVKYTTEGPKIIDKPKFIKKKY